MSFIDYSLGEFTDALASKAPVPGGGGACALVGAAGTALGSMVGNLTVGKKKYAQFQPDILRLLESARELRAKLLRLIDEDAAAFLPLSKAYGLPGESPEQREEKARVMESCLREACSVPLKIMEALCEAIRLHAQLAEKGSALVISDVGTGVICCKAALQGASLNVFINTKYMSDREYASRAEAQAQDILNTYCSQADQVFSKVVSRLR